MKKGFKAELLDEIVNVITSRRKVWIDTMMREELGLIEEKKKPLDGAITTFAAFNLVGLVPLIPFVFLHLSGFTISTEHAFLYSVVFTGISFFLIGIVRGKIVNKSLLRTGINTLAVGGIARFCSLCSRLPIGNHRKMRIRLKGLFHTSFQSRRYLLLL